MKTRLAVLLLVAVVAASFPVSPCTAAEQSPAATQPNGLVSPSTPSPREIVATQDRWRILQSADAALTLKPFSVTFDRSPLSEGGPHDFFSMSDYFWPDPSKPDGKPYLMRDGQSNPDNFNKHRESLMAMRDATAALAAAFLVTKDEKYAAQRQSCCVCSLSIPPRA